MRRMEKAATVQLDFDDSKTDDSKLTEGWSASLGSRDADNECTVVSACDCGFAGATQMGACRAQVEAAMDVAGEFARAQCPAATACS